MKIVLRPAEKRDVRELALLVARLKSLNEELDPHFKVVEDVSEVSLKYVQDTLSSPTAFIIVAEDQEAGVIAGMIRVEVVDRLFYEPRLKAVITDIYVRPKYRRKRVGILLLEKAVEEAKKRGAGIITAIYPANNVIASSFYKRLGFTKLQEEVYKPL